LELAVLSRQGSAVAPIDGQEYLTKLKTINGLIIGSTVEIVIQTLTLCGQFGDARFPALLQW
jgi:hypothetical protein